MSPLYSIQLYARLFGMTYALPPAGTAPHGAGTSFRAGNKACQADTQAAHHCSGNEVPRECAPAVALSTEDRTPYNFAPARSWAEVLHHFSYIPGAAKGRFLSQILTYRSASLILAAPFFSLRPRHPDIPMHDNTTDYCSTRSLGKKYLYTLFRQLKKSYYPIYNLLCTLPKEQFVLYLRYDYRYKKKGAEALLEVYSIQEFIESYNKFSTRDEFDIWIYNIILYNESQFDLAYASDMYRKFVWRHCEQGLRSNAPAHLTPEQARRHGLKRRDAEAVREMLRVCNSEITDRLQAKYDSLKALKCIRR